MSPRFIRNDYGRRDSLARRQELIRMPIARERSLWAVLRGAAGADWLAMLMGAAIIVGVVML